MQQLRRAGHPLSYSRLERDPDVVKSAETGAVFVPLTLRSGRVALLEVFPDGCVMEVRSDGCALDPELVGADAAREARP